jgi:hypothetical protein
MPLNRLRAARKLTQEHLAKLLNRDQSAISQMERRTDMYVSTWLISSGPWEGNSKSGPTFPTGLSGSRESPKLIPNPRNSADRPFEGFGPIRVNAGFN